MRQIFPGSIINALDAVNRSYANPFGSTAQADSATTRVAAPWGATGQLTNVRIKLSAALPIASTFSLYNITQGIQLDITVPTATTDITSAGTLAVTAGDLIAVRHPINQSGPAKYVKWSFEFIGTNANEAVLGGGIYTSTSVDETGEDNTFLFLFPDSQPSATEAKRRFYCPIAGTLKSFYVKLSANSGGVGTRTISIYKNGVLEATTSLTFASGENSKSVTGLNIPFVPGDSLSVHHDTAGGDVSQVGMTWGLMYNPVVDGEFMLGGMVDANPLSTTQDATEYGWFSGAIGTNTAWSLDTLANEGLRQSVSGGVACAVRAFRVDLETAPGVSQTRRFRLRKDTADSLMVLDIAGTDATATDNIHSETLADGTVLSISHEVISGGVNACATARWSFALYIDPAGTGGSGQVGGVSTEELPVFNPSVGAALKLVQQGATFPQFVLAAQGGAGGTDYGLYKKGSAYNQHLMRFEVLSIGRRFSVKRIVLRLGAAVQGLAAITPRLYFDNKSRSQNGMEINTLNFPANNDNPTGVRQITLTEDSFEKNTEGRNNFFLELQWTGSALLPVVLPAYFEVEIYDNPND